MALTAGLRLLRHQVPQGEIIYDILDILDLVLETVAPPAQRVVLEVENLKAGKEVLDKLIDEKRALIISKSDRIASKT